MFNKNLTLVICYVIISFAACNRTTKFDSDLWNEGDGLTFSYRESMVDDLLQNQKLKGLKYQQVIHLLHRPQLSNKSQMMYEITDIFKQGQPRYVKQLVLAMKDSIVVDAKLYEHTAKK